MKTPEPFYNCSNPACEECTYPADLLYWSAKHQGFYCLPSCWDYRELSDLLDGEEPGISLADHLKQTVAVVPRELGAEHTAKLDGNNYDVVLDRKGRRHVVTIPVDKLLDIYRRAIEAVEIKEKRC